LIFAGLKNKRRKARDEAKQNIISIIESIVSDTPKSEDSVKSEATTNDPESAQQELSDVPTPTEQNLESCSNQNIEENKT
uniref:Uncharacterized protein n=1 Tax=Meloidogyne floridensis TaxID=298350 RepID=A0A915P6S2_9BILA